MPRYINRLLKAQRVAKTIGCLENLEEKTRFVLEAAASVHDIGMKPALEKYGSSNGKYQEQEGTIQAEVILQQLGYPKEVI